MYLLDTNALICVLFTPERLSPSARQIIESYDNLFVSVASLWEIAIKQSIGKLDIDAAVPEIVEACAALNIKRLQIEPEHIEKIKYLPPIHRDPFDRLIISQAVSEGLTIITMDQTIPQYEVKTLW